MDVTPPTVLTSRGFAGQIPNTVLGNVAWNEDGQCLFLASKSVTIVVSEVIAFGSKYPFMPSMGYLLTG
jgi:hypothetical protein